MQSRTRVYLLWWRMIFFRGKSTLKDCLVVEAGSTAIGRKAWRTLDHDRQLILRFGCVNCNGDMLSRGYHSKRYCAKAVNARHAASHWVMSDRRITPPLVMRRPCIAFLTWVRACAYDSPSEAGNSLQLFGWYNQDRWLQYYVQHCKSIGFNSQVRLLSLQAESLLLRRQPAVPDAQAPSAG